MKSIVDNGGGGGGPDDPPSEGGGPGGGGAAPLPASLPYAGLGLVAGLLPKPFPSEKSSGGGGLRNRSLSRAYRLSVSKPLEESGGGMAPMPTPSPCVKAAGPPPPPPPAVGVLYR